MNPYDFVPINWQQVEPERHTPIWHHHLASQSNEQKLYSGFIEIELEAETPIFIPQPRERSNKRDNKQDHDEPITFIRNGKGDYIIPAISLKGMLRCVVETLGNGCLTIFDGDYEPDKSKKGGWEERCTVHYKEMILPNFRHCDDPTQLCIACRMFGMLHQDKVFLGKVNISDAYAPPKYIHLYEWGSIYTPILQSPKPRHKAFYLIKEGSQEYIAGRKYYFHHKNQGLETREELDNLNQHILPLDYGSRFFCRIDFTNLEANEFALLLLAIRLQSDMRHKIGGGKPFGLGTVHHLTPYRLKLVDYTKRYTLQSTDHGFTTWDEETLKQALAEKMQSLDHKIASSIDYYLAQKAMQELHRIWLWKPEKGIEYFYPERSWFKANKQKSIRETRS